MQDQQQSYHELSSKAAWKPRRWRGHWLQCCGPECSAEDAAGCCIGCYLPCIAYSWNVSKVLHAPFWRSLLVYVCLLWLVGWLANGLNIGKAIACLPRGDGNAEPRDAAACSTLTTLATLAGLAGFACLVCWAVFVGGARRRRMREELGIALTDEGRCCSRCHNNSEHCNDDCCLHYFCLSCALAQETRTILHQEATGQMPPRLVNGGYRPSLTGEGERDPLMINPATTAPAALAGGMQRGPAAAQAANGMLPV